MKIHCNILNLLLKLRKNVFLRKNIFENFLYYLSKYISRQGSQHMTMNVIKQSSSLQQI